MKALCIYVDAGKGHYVPCKAVAEEFEAMGMDVEFKEFFEYLDASWMKKINEGIWRLMLRVPFIERRFVRSLDSKNNFNRLTKLMFRYRLDYFKELMKSSKPDLVFTTHGYGASIISALLEAVGENIPVYYFATDVFTTTVIAICPRLRKFYIATEEGAERVKAMGQKEDTITICPFPLQRSVASVPKLPKPEARRKLELDPEMFTIQLNLGGEGLGSLALLEEIIKEDLPLQVVIIGGIKKQMKKKLDSLAKRSSEGKTRVYVRGYVNNVSEYLSASDVIVGRAGINTIVEAIYMHRPFLITELVYSVIPSAEYIEKHHVGWNATDDIHKQISIIKQLVSNPLLLDQMEEAFDKVPIVYSAEALAKMTAEDAAACAHKENLQ